MRIGEFASKVGVNIQTIRFYERRRILPAPARNASGYRLYGDNDLVNLSFIKQSQELGFTLAEIRQLLQIHSSLASKKANLMQSSRTDEFGRFARLKVEQVDQKLRFLRAVRTQLLSFIDQLETVRGCPGAARPVRDLHNTHPTPRNPRS